jgi:hypothetical protein
VRRLQSSRSWTIFPCFPPELKREKTKNHT